MSLTDERFGHIFPNIMVENSLNTAETRTQAVEPARVGDSLPKAMGPGDMCKAFGISYTVFHHRELAGEFKPFLLPRAIGRKRFSGEKVQAFLNGRK